MQEFEVGPEETVAGLSVRFHRGKAGGKIESPNAEASIREGLIVLFVSSVLWVCPSMEHNCLLHSFLFSIRTDLYCWSHHIFLLCFTSSSFLLSFLVLWDKKKKKKDLAGGVGEDQKPC